MRRWRALAGAIRSIAPLILAPVVFLAAGCGPGVRTASEVILPFMEAVQEEDLESLFCLAAGASEAPELGADESERRENFASWAEAQYDIYLVGRDEGWVDLEGHGIVAVKLFSLGRGAYFTYGPIRSPDSETLTVDTALRLGYSQLDLSGMSPGTTFYLCGVPPGKVHAIRVPAGSREFDVEVLEGIVLRWTLVRRPASGGCQDGWAVASVVPLEESVSSEVISWSF